MRFLQVILVAVLAATALPQAAAAECAKVRSTRPGEVYLLRGLANIFSLGLDGMGKEFSKLGIENCVFNHSVWQSLGDEIIERSTRGEISEPIVIVGHSLGAGAAPRLATMLGKRNVKVSYVVMMDPVEPTVVGRNVRQIVNYYLPKRKDNKLYAGNDFDGELDNVNVARFGGFDHFNIDENRSLQKLIEARTLELSDEILMASAGDPGIQRKPVARKKKR
jgi:hypothetical protein